MTPTRPLPDCLSQEEFAQREPLTTRLRGLLRSYPKGIGLIQEFLQNADDAGARKVRFVLDERTYSFTALPSPQMSRLQGPALVVINDSSFSDTDWRDIQRIGQSGKELDTTKTGRFGLGFNSVYNVTDWPMLLTGQRIGVFDPHGDTVPSTSTGTWGAAWRLDEHLWSKCADLLAPFRDFGLRPHATEAVGTVFRLPLRNTEQATRSEISSQPFDVQDFTHIVDKLRNRIQELLLFLKNVQDLEISRVDPLGAIQPLLSARTCNSDAVNIARGQLRQALATEHSRLLDLLAAPDAPPAISDFEHEIEVAELDRAPTRLRFLIIHGLFCDPAGLVADCARRMVKLNEKAVPLAGAAARVDGVEVDTAGRLFCGLPLPIGSPVTSCHVNGFFDLQSDRQGLFQDPGAEGGSAVRVEWNRLLIEHCCSEAVARLCLRLTFRAMNETLSLYEHWPRVDQHELSLLDRLPRHVYERLRTYACILAGGSEEWRLPQDVVLPPPTGNESLQSALLSDEFSIPNPALPDYVSAGFAAAGPPLPVLSPTQLRASLRVPTDPKVPIESAPRPCLRNPAWVAALLEFCLSDDKIEDLLGVPLAYMSDGTLRAFGRDLKARICLGGDDERELLARMTTWFIDSSLEEAVRLKESTAVGLLRVNARVVVSNLAKVLPPIGADGRVDVSTRADTAPSETWLTRAFEYLTAHATEIKTLDRDTIQKLPLVPDQFACLHGMGTAHTPLLPTTDDSKALTSALTALGVPLVSGNEELLKAIRAFVDAFPHQAVWRLSPLDLVDTLSVAAQQPLVQVAATSQRDVAPILDYLATARAVKDLKADAERVEKLRALRIFPSKSGQLVSLIIGEHHIPADYRLPNVNTEVGLLDCGRDDRWIALYEALRVPKLTRTRLLTQVVLPRVKELSARDTHAVLTWLRHHLRDIKEEETKDNTDALLARLGNSIPVRCTDGDTRPPRLLYHPDAQFVSTLLGDGVGFPDLSVYSDRSDLWLEFFETLGMAGTPRPDDIVAAIDEALGSDETLEVKTSRITDIAEYLDHNWDQLNEQPVDSDRLRPAQAVAWHLSDSLSCREWLPTLQSAPAEYPRELLLATNHPFMKPSEMLVRAALGLIGSVSPVCRIDRIFRMQGSIGLRTDATLDEVLKHFDNVVALAASQGGAVSERLATVFRRVYDFLGREFADAQESIFGADPGFAAIRDRFAARPCLIDVDRRPWLPGHCFEESVSTFLGRRVRVRSENPNVDRGLTILGRRARPVADDYVALFDELAKVHGVSPIPDGDRPLLRSAYMAAATLAGSETFARSPVLLETGALASAGETILDDAPWLSARARAAGMRFLDPQLGQVTARAFGVRLLSSAVYESPEHERRSESKTFVDECTSLESRLRSPELCAGVRRLLSASDIAIRGASLRQFFDALRVIPVAQLQTTLVWTDGDVRVEGSQGECDVVFDPRRNAVLVCEDAQEVLYERVGSVLINELRVDGHDLSNSAAHFVAILRVDAGTIERLLTKLHVRVQPIALEEVATNADESDGFIDEGQVCGASGMPVSPDGEEGGTHDHAAWVPVGSEGSSEHLLNSEASQSGSQPDAELPAAADGGGRPYTHRPGTQSSSDGIDDGPLEQRPRDGTRASSPSPQDPSSGSRSEAIISTSKATESQEIARHGPLGRPTTPSPFQRGRARTYVNPTPDGGDQESPERQERRRRVDQAAVQRVLKFESERGRCPTEMPHSNEGYDVESRRPDGGFDRFIEVKGVSGLWSDFGVPVSRNQFRKATKEGASYWLYVVEFALEPNRARVYAIQDPADLVDEYWFDGGWRDFSKEREGTCADVTPKEGSLVLVDASRRGRVTSIHKRGVLMHLEVEFEDDSRDQVIFSPRRVQVLPDEEAR